ncbi:MAG: DMT family transporter [Corynebacterium sp.]|nr:DMT family transporter [Corynebacterium sp.]
MLSTVLAIFFALSSALVIAWGTVVRQSIAVQSTVGKVMRTAMSNPLWWVGTGSAVVAYGLQMIALGFGTLLIVQPILVLSLMFTLPLAAWYQKRQMGRSEILWSGLLTLAVAVLVVLGRPVQGIAAPPLHDWVPALLIVFGGIAALIFSAAHSARFRALLLGAACGALYGFVAMLSKTVADTYVHHGLPALLQSWSLWLLIVAAGCGTIMQQYSFQAGSLNQSLPAMTIVEPLVAFSLGIGVLQERFQVSSAAGWTVMAIAVVVMLGATIVLSRQPLRPKFIIIEKTSPAQAAG